MRLVCEACSADLMPQVGFPFGSSLWRVRDPPIGYPWVTVSGFDRRCAPGKEAHRSSNENEEESTVLRQITFSRVLVLALVVVCGWVLFASIGAPAHWPPEASPQAPGGAAHPQGPIAGAMGRPTPPPIVRGPAAWATPPGWAAAPIRAGCTAGVQPASPLEQTAQRGEYANRTDPSASGPFAGATLVRPPAHAASLLLALAMIVAIIAIGRSSRQATEAPARARVTSSSARPGPVLWQRLKGDPPPLARLHPLSLFLSDQTADWERVRLVPT